MRFRLLLAVLITGTFSVSVGAAQHACPELSNAAQVNACPTEDELKHTYSGFCSDNGKAYAKETDSCLRYEDYRDMKNTARWESQDGLFDGYVSCGLQPAKVKSLKATAMRIERQGKLTKVVCSYAEHINFTLRTKASCVIDDAKACAENAANCRANCN